MLEELKSALHLNDRGGIHKKIVGLKKKAKKVPHVFFQCFGVMCIHNGMHH